MRRREGLRATLGFGACLPEPALLPAPAPLLVSVRVRGTGRLVVQEVLGASRCDGYGGVVGAGDNDGRGGGSPQNPLDHALFLKSAECVIRAARAHPSVVVYVGGNEQVPSDPKP